MAPVRMVGRSFRASPDTMGAPYPPAPTNAAKVAVPMLTMVAVLIPASSVGLARGSTTRNRTWRRFRPKARAFSRWMGVDGANAGEGILHHRQQAVQTQRRQGGPGSHPKYRNEKAQQGQRGHRLNQSARQQDGLTRGVESHRHHPQGDADQHREQQRHPDQPQMFLGAVGHSAQPVLGIRSFGSQELSGNFLEGTFSMSACAFISSMAVSLILPSRPSSACHSRGCCSTKDFLGDPDRLVHGKIIVIVLQQPQMQLLDPWHPSNTRRSDSRRSDRWPESSACAPCD